MSINKNRGRHRSNSNIWTTIAQVSPAKARTFGGTAAAVVAGSGLMFGMAAPAQAGVVANDPAPAAAAAPAAAPAAVTVAEAPAVETASTHTVVAGDTLGQIAATYGVSLDSIFALNGLSMSSIIYPGDVITYAGTADIQPAAAYTPVETAAVVEAAPAAATYTDPGTYTEYSTLSTQVTPAAPSVGTSAIGQTMVNAAYSQLGAAQDCTVLVEVALRAAGHSVGDLAPAQLAAYGSPVSDPQPGDMVYYADGGMGFAHIAIYIGDGQAIHSGWNGNQTVIQSVNVGSGPVYYRA